MIYTTRDNHGVLLEVDDEERTLRRDGVLIEDTPEQFDELIKAIHANDPRIN